MHEFHVGDRVYVPYFDQSNRPAWAVSGMDKLSDNTYTVRLIDYDGGDAWIAFNEVDWAWKSDWLRPAYDYKVGDRVYVKPFTPSDGPYWACKEMAEYSGMEHTITGINGDVYSLDCCGYAWFRDIFEPADLAPEFESESTEDLLSLFGFAV